MPKSGIPIPIKPTHKRRSLKENKKDEEGKKSENKKSEPKEPVRKWRRVKRSAALARSYNIPGVYKVIIPLEHQKLLKCVVGVDVSMEKPTAYSPKDILEYFLEVEGAACAFFKMKKEVLNFPNDDVLVVYIQDESKSYDQYYICLSEKAEPVILELVEKEHKKREDRLNNSIFKKANPWTTQGSDAEVEDLTLKNTRPLLEVVAEVRYPLRPITQLRLRMVEDVKNSYAEMLPGRGVYTNIIRSQLDAMVQVHRSTVTKETQTVSPSMYVNACTQYEFSYEQVRKLTPEFTRSMRFFLRTQMAIMDEMLFINKHIDLYENDYVKLVRDPKYTQAPDPRYIKLRTTFMDHNNGKLGKEIYKLCWHPKWINFAAIWYSYSAPSSYKKKKPNEDEVARAVHELSPVLLWHAVDNVAPKLMLETPREITAMSFCPYDENILVGGCYSGQIIIWDLKDKLELSVQQEVLTAEQQIYRRRLSPLMTWMKFNTDKKTVRTTAASDLLYSHKGAVTSIQWVSPHRKISRCGIVSEVEDGQLSFLFVTSSTDGSILFWDLSAKPTRGHNRRMRKLQRLKRRPSGLILNVSPFKEFDRVLRPIYKVNIIDPDTGEALLITQLRIKKELDVHPAVNQFVVGTARGAFLIATWSGFDFDSGLVVNEEACQIASFGRIHDGPVLSVCRSRIFYDIILTVGGKVFAIWKMDYLDAPVVWRKCEQRYTHGAWDIERPSVLLLTRCDGAVEMWNFKIRSDRYQHLRVISGRSLTGLYVCPPTYKKNFIGIASYQGLLRLCSVHHNVLGEYNINEMLEREIDRKLGLAKWREGWEVRNAEWVASKRMQEYEKQRLREEEQQRENELRKTATNIHSRRASSSSHPNTGFELWKKRERKIFRETVLNNKGYNMDVLERQRLPLIKDAKAENIKRAKQSVRLQEADRKFQKTVAVHFPEIVGKKPLPSSDPYAGGDFLREKEIYFNSYRQLANTTGDFLNKRDYYYYIGWLDIISRAKLKMERRKRMYALYENPYSSKELVQEKLMQHDEAYVAHRHLEKIRPSEKFPAFSKLYDGMLSALDSEETEICNTLLDL